MADSPEPPPNVSADDRLDSWKEIGAYLKRNVRTVRRWETSEGLPVHRHVHNRKATVYAYKAEVDAWWRERRQELAQNRPSLVPSRFSGGRFTTLIGIATLTALLAAVLMAGALPSRDISTESTSLPITGRLAAHATSETGRIDWIAIGFRPEHVVLTADRRLYVTGERGVAVVDPQTRAIRQPFAELARSYVSLTASRDASRIYASTANGEILVIDTASQRVRHLGSTPRPVADIAVTPNERKLFLALEYGGLMRLDIVTGAMAKLPTVACPRQVAVTPDGARLYVNYQCGGPGGSPGHDAIDVVDVATERTMATITGLANVGGAIVVTPNGAQLWADGGDACFNPSYDQSGCPVRSATITNIIRTSDRRLIRSLTGLGRFVGFSPDGSRAVFSRDDAVQLVDTTTFAVLETLPINGNRPAFDLEDGRMYVPVPDKRAVAVVSFERERCRPALPTLWSLWAGDGNGSDVRDGNHATLALPDAFAPGLVGRAFRFDPGAGPVQATISSNYFVGNFTMAGWVKFEPRQPDLGRLETIASVTYLAGVDSRYWLLERMRDGRLAACDTDRLAGCNSENRSTVVSGAPAADDVWHHVALSRAGNMMTMYVNGSEAGHDVAEQRRDPGWPWPSPELRIGSSPKGDGMVGLVDEFELYAGGLAAADIANLAKSGHLPVCQAGER